jgi:AAA15 family ATPase/GTPase
MIKDIEINNFRCFDRLKVSGCKRINLISGKNNVGKTALLEAIFVNSMPTSGTLFSIGEFRRESSSFSKAFSEKMWDNLFFQQNVKYICSIATIFNDLSCKIVEISIIDKKLLLNNDLIPKYEIQHVYDDSDQFILSVNTKIDDLDSLQTIVFSRDRQLSREKKFNVTFNLKYLQNSSFIPSSQIFSSISLTKEFDKARLNEKDDEVLKAFQIIDSSIVAVESFSIPEPTIYLRRQGEKRLPLSLFGDAMNRIAEIILKIINNQDSVLLIDEIENGIHHSSQIAFWDFLYKLADRLNVQIFATTHSLEMTEAFIKAGLDRQDSAAHFELTRHEKTNKIVAINRDLETLEYGISHHQEVRGGA